MLKKYKWQHLTKYCTLKIKQYKDFYLISESFVFINHVNKLIH